jgi:hypothetical protein
VGHAVSLSGVVVTGQPLAALAPLAAIGLSADPAELPIAGRFRLRDLALAACRGARVCLVDAGGDGPRVARALQAWQRLETHAAASLVLVADHLVHADLGVLARRRAARGAALALGCVPVHEAGGRPWPRLAADADGRIIAVGGADDDLPLAWPGDLAVAAGALRPAHVAATDDAGLLARLVAALPVVAVDHWAEPADDRAWCTAPTSIESWYEAQMGLCGRADVAPAATLAALPVDAPRAPARLLVDGGQLPQVVSTLVGDGATIRGATVLRSVLGPGTVVEAGAEIEDCVLLAGAHVGRGAAIRRAIVGAGVAIPAGARIGWDDAPMSGVVALASGLCLVGAPSAV